MGKARRIAPKETTIADAHDARAEGQGRHESQQTPGTTLPAQSDVNGAGKPTGSSLIGRNLDLSSASQLRTLQAGAATSIGDTAKVGRSISSAMSLPAEIMKGVIGASEGLAESIAAILQPVRDVWSQIGKLTQIPESSIAWNPHFMKQWQDAAGCLAESASGFRALVIKYTATLITFRWPPPTMETDSGDMQHIVNISDSLSHTEAETEIDAFMLQRHGSDYVKERLDEWKHHSWISNRFPILVAAVNAHVQGLYELSVPTLLPQIEGVIWEGYGSTSRCLQREEMRLATALCSDGLDFLDDMAKRFFLDTLLQEFNLGEPVPGLSRHAILHGIDTHYATQINSLKLILLFDYFLGAFGVVSLDNSMTYHKLGCPHIQHSASHRTVYGSHESARRAGKKPCRSCHPEHL
ncbi:hypothetical protein [Candidatus Cryosericum terrychapinii]|uniref:Uncharacterized protein n=1 Tax=Candidatus Cryosericum terrychapinii TaxID=2290919 RepID=A0A398CTK0_9BACT|nr:hypothetical protein [Candidatus Cryosericum terrychapinii]RIE05922.1 hypothetical protein SMC7_05120 [Candidatus Cryosericum terrychapinii]